MILVSVIVIFQLVLIGPMYENNKTNSLRKAVDEIIDAVGSNDFEEVVYDVSVQNDVCIRVYQETQSSYLESGNMGCILYRMNDMDIRREVAKAQENGNSNVSIWEQFLGHPDGRKDMKSIIYTRIVEEDNGNMVILANTNITPLDPATNTLKSQLLYISIIITLSAFLFAYFMNKHIAKPLTLINTAAKELPQGKYNVSSPVDEYVEAKELNETLAKAAIEIQQAEQAKRDLISNVSHDLRTPLTMIHGYGEMMRDLPGEKTDENIQVVIDESERLTSLVNDLLDLSRLQEGKIVLTKEEVNLSELLTTELRKYEIYHVEDGFEFETHIEPDVIVSCDKKRIQQVFNNFMANAINYSLDKKKVVVECRKEDNEAYVKVQDFGQGIEKDKLPYIWDRYYKIPEHHVRFSSGSGIGLSIVKQILQLHDVPFGVDSEATKGSSFWFKLPLVTDKENILAEHSY